MHKFKTNFVDGSLFNVFQFIVMWVPVPKLKKPVYLLVMEVGNKPIYLKDSSAVLPYLAMSNPVKEDRVCDLLLCLKACIFSDSIVYTRLLNVSNKK